MTRSRNVTIAAAALLAGVCAGTVLSAGRAAESLMKSAVFQWDELSPSPTSVGAVRRVVRAPTATLDELESHITTLDANQSPHAPHQHPNEELLVLKEGTVDAYVNGEWVTVRTGGIMFFASNVPHTVRNVSDRPATYYVFNWSPAAIREKGTNSR
jgi:mannose-6-phosphate isomerase-like protein (cupin superfamily)